MSLFFISGVKFKALISEFHFDSSFKRMLQFEFSCFPRIFPLVELKLVLGEIKYKREVVYVGGLRLSICGTEMSPWDS